MDDRIIFTLCGALAQWHCSEHEIMDTYHMGNNMNEEDISK